MKENSIEEARERLEKGIKDIWFSTTYSQEQEEKDLKILLSDYKRVLKENEEVHKENEHLHREINRRIKLKIENEKIVDTQFISIQKIKDKIKHYQELQDNYIKKYDEINEGLQAMINVLQELLESEE